MPFTNMSKKGPSFDYYGRFTITSTTFGGDDGYNTGGDGYLPQVVIPFSSQAIIVLLETSGSVVEGSFNGKDVHFRLDSTITNGIAQRFDYNNRVDAFIWFRYVSGTSPIVQVQSWGIR